ncbi:hypothetical protein B6S12_08130 [Helicobacter valdiviensis]|uniref:Uncharacterized protein n=1 Tax=Helicobacter valdiviensis TaxID=1458358 RepID=A0A2W6MWI4_9HELI|nr:hypothetical protein B6S12_08130 [Helicobacter valdiviensis]
MIIAYKNTKRNYQEIATIYPNKDCNASLQKHSSQKPKDTHKAQSINLSFINSDKKQKSLNKRQKEKILTCFAFRRIF